jgi:hypothetical protein
MKLFQKLYNLLFKTSQEKLTKHNRLNQLCSLNLSITNEDEYNFEITWSNTDQNKSVNGLCNLILGITYGLFSTDIISILKEYDGGNSTVDVNIVNNTILSIESQIKILDNIIKKNSSTNKPLIKPSEVLKHDS